MDLYALPIVPNKDGEKQVAKIVRHAVQAEGRAAFLMGKKITDCPRFVHPDMAVGWTMGFRWAKEENDGK